MGGLYDGTVVLGLESTYNTLVTPTRSLEVAASSAIDFDTMPLTGSGLVPGGNFDRSNRRIGTIGQGDGKIEADLLSRGFGLLLGGGFGTSASQLVSGSTYQQLFTTAIPNGVTLNSYTVQEQVPLNDGTIITKTYTGCSVKSLEISLSMGEAVKVSASIDARAHVAGQAAAATGYQNAASQYAYPGASAQIGGTLTNPTGTALASSTGPASPVKDWTFSLDNGLDVGNWVLGGRAQPTVGKRTGKLRLKVNANDLALRDLYLAQTAFPVLLQVTTPEVLSAAPGTAVMQIALPAVMIDAGALPAITDGSTNIIDVNTSIMRPAAGGQAAYMVLRTLDTTL